jgi:hypothetical protein
MSFARLTVFPGAPVGDVSELKGPVSGDVVVEVSSADVTTINGPNGLATLVTSNDGGIIIGDVSYTVSSATVKIEPSTNTVTIGDNFGGSPIVSFQVDTGVLDVIGGEYRLNGEPGIYAVDPLSGQNFSINLSTSQNHACILSNSTSPVVFTLLTSLPNGYRTKVIRQNTGAVSFTAGPGATLNSLSGAFAITGRYGFAEVQKVSPTQFIITGNI